MADDRSQRLVQDALEQANQARKEFDSADKDINESAARILRSMADLSEKNPEEFFGLKPTERERFLVLNLMRAAEAGQAPGGATVDITGSASVLGGLGILRELADVLKSPQGPEIVKEILGFVRAEKQFMKDTVKEGIDGVIGLFGGS